MCVFDERMMEPGFDKVMKAIGKQLKEKSVKAKIKCFEVLFEIAIINPNYLIKYIPSFAISIKKALLVTN